MNKRKILIEHHNNDKKCFNVRWSVPVLPYNGTTANNTITLCLTISRFSCDFLRRSRAFNFNECSLLCRRDFFHFFYHCSKKNHFFFIHFTIELCSYIAFCSIYHFQLYSKLKWELSTWKKNVFSAILWYATWYTMKVHKNNESITIFSIFHLFRSFLPHIFRLAAMHVTIAP